MGAESKTSIVIFNCGDVYCIVCVQCTHGSQTTIFRSGFSTPSCGRSLCSHCCMSFRQNSSLCLSTRHRNTGSQSHAMMQCIQQSTSGFQGSVCVCAYVCECMCILHYHLCSLFCICICVVCMHVCMFMCVGALMCSCVEAWSNAVSFLVPLYLTKAGSLWA